MTDDLDGLFIDNGQDDLMLGSEFDGAPPRPAKGYATINWAWLARVYPQVGSKKQLIVAMVLYTECLLQRSTTVRLSNRVLRELGINRKVKYQAFRNLEDAGEISVGEPEGRRAIQVTLRRFP